MLGLNAYMSSLDAMVQCQAKNSDLNSMPMCHVYASYLYAKSKFEKIIK